MTIEETLRRITQALTGHSDAPHIDAQQIVLHALKQSNPTYLISHAHDELSDDAQAAIETMQESRATGMPLAYILGEADFYGRTFTVTPDVLIPRPDTEELVTQALAAIDHLTKNKQPITIADIGTGSGCIASTIALERPETVRIIASDISPAALAIAKQNAIRHGVDNRITFLEGDMLAPYADKHIDLIVSNPPYVPTQELEHAADSVHTAGLLFEPRTALDGGADGLTFVQQIKASNIPALVETIGGEIVTYNMKQ